jgi:large subunit ribosomal protein L7/L12
MSKDEIKEALSQMTVLELVELVKELEEEWGVSAAAPVAVAAGAVAGGGEAAAEEEQTEFDVILSSFGDKKIQVIKEVRSLTSLGLQEAKKLVEGAPIAVKEGVEKEEAEQIKEKLEAVGAIIEIK